MNNYELRLWFRNQTYLDWIYYSFTFGLLLIIPTVFYDVAFWIALSIIAIPVVVMAIFFRDDPDVDKIIFATSIVTLIIYMTVLALVVKFLWLIMMAALAVSHSISFKLIHYFKHRFEPDKRKFDLFKSKDLWNNILYLVPFLMISTFGVLQYPQALSLEIQNTNVNPAIITSLIHGTQFEPLYNFAIAASDFGLDNLKHIKNNLLRLFKYSGYFAAFTYFLKFIYSDD